MTDGQGMGECDFTEEKDDEYIGVSAARAFAHIVRGVASEMQCCNSKAAWNMVAAVERDMKRIERRLEYKMKS